MEHETPLLPREREEKRQTWALRGLAFPPASIELSFEFLPTLPETGESQQGRQSTSISEQRQSYLFALDPVTIC